MFFFVPIIIRFDDAVRMVGLCCSGAYDFNVDR